MMRDCQMYSRKVALSKTIISCSNHDFTPKTYRIIIVNSDVLVVPNILNPLAIFRNWGSHLTSLRFLRRVANE
jgi:hypothetical protein